MDEHCKITNRLSIFNTTCIMFYFNQFQRIFFLQSSLVTNVNPAQKYCVMCIASYAAQLGIRMVYMAT